MTRRAFTVEEANALLPELGRILERIEEIQKGAVVHHERLQLLEVLWGERLRDADNPDHGEFARHRAGLQEAADRIGDLVEREIAGRGIRFPTGGLEHGLLDFPTILDGRWIYLCWQRGESRVGFWHEVDGGFRGRRRITDEEARRMGPGDGSADIDGSRLDF